VRAAVLLLLAALVAPVAGGGALTLPPITRTTLANGLRLIVVEYHELPLAEFYGIVGAGAAQDPPGREGLAALTATLVTRGSAGLDAAAFARAVEGLGGELEVNAGTDGTILNGEFLAKDFAEAVQLVRGALRDPTFARDEVRRARDEQGAGLRAALESPSAVAEKCFAAFLYGAHPYGRPIDGRTTTVPDLDRGDVRDFHDRWYRPNDTILVVVGDVDARAAVTRLEQAFGDWTPRADAVAPRTPTPPPFTGRRLLLVDKPDAVQTQIRFGNFSIPRNHPDYVTATVANTILGGGFSSQLIEELRVKRSLTYSAWSAFAARLTGGDFRIGTFTKSPTTADALALALEVEGRFRSTAPDPKALDKAKAYLRGQYPLRVEAPDALAGRLAEIEFNGLPPDELTTYLDRVTAVSGADVARVSSALMPPADAVAIVVVGNAGQIRDGLAARFSTFDTIPPTACENLSDPRRRPGS
jgi:zinc protease